jgi:alkylated DNA repair protein (DNA oxidative demethylase)
MGRCKREAGGEMTESSGMFPMGTSTLDLNGVRVVSGLLDRCAQEALVAVLRGLLKVAPLHQPVMPNGKPMSVRMTAAGRFGWISDKGGYRYADQHPSGVAWPPIPAPVMELWRLLAPGARDPECCLINYYAPEARMGLHQDRDEADFTQPVLSISLGDDGLFRVGGPNRKDPTRSVWLTSGDVAVLEGAARRAFHGIDRIKLGTSTLLDRPGRINLTLRVVT